MKPSVKEEQTEKLVINQQRMFRVGNLKQADKKSTEEKSKTPDLTN